MAVEFTTHHHLLYGEQDEEVTPFIGAYATADVPAASTITPGFYYWDLTLAQPFWSDGAIWRDAGATTVPEPDLGLEVTFTMHEDATEFSPWITLVEGASGTINWYDSTDTLIATGDNPTIPVPVDLTVTTPERPTSLPFDGWWSGLAR